MKNEIDIDQAGKRQEDNLSSIVPLHKLEEGADESDMGASVSQFEDLRKFEPVIEHFCFEQHIPLKELIDSFERAVLIKVLSKFNGNQRQSAKYLGMKSSTLNEKIKKHNIHFKKEAF